MRAVGDRLETMQYEHSQALPFPWELIINQDSTFWGAYQMALYSLYSVLLLTRAHRALVPFGTKACSLGFSWCSSDIPGDTLLAWRTGWDLGSRLQNQKTPLSRSCPPTLSEKPHGVCAVSLPSNSKVSPFTFPEAPRHCGSFSTEVSFQ